MSHSDPTRRSSDLRKAVRRLGEMLLGIDALLGRLVALTQPRQALAVFIRGVGLLARAANKTLVVAAFFVEREIAGKEHDLPGRAQRGTARAVGEFDGRTLHSRGRSAERRVGKECVSPCRSRLSPSHSKKTQTKEANKI